MFFPKIQNKPQIDNKENCIKIVQKHNHLCWNDNLFKLKTFELFLKLFLLVWLVPQLPYTVPAYRAFTK